MIDTETQTWGDDVTLATKARLSVSEFQSRREAEPRVAKFPGYAETTARITQAEQKADAEREKLEKLRQDVFTWESLLAARERILARMSRAENQLQELQGMAEGRAEFLTNAWGGEVNVSDASAHPSVMARFYSELVGMREAVRSFPASREKMQTELDAANTALTAFAKQHRILDRLPSELISKA